MVWSISELKASLRALFGENENSDGDVNTTAGRLLEQVFEYDWREMSDSAANQHVRRDAQTISLSASQALAERVVFTAPWPCRVKEMYFAQYVSSTVTTTDTMAWGLLVRKRGGSYPTSSETNTYSISYFVGALASNTGKMGTRSWSWSALSKNVAHAPNKLHLATGTASGKLDLGEKDVLTAACVKGSGTATDSGAIFRGGRLTIVVEKTGNRSSSQ